jgi:wyosine [tRNA(Phe)-imidazoG37] synthetase (radical SAM superfamily)
MADTPRQPLLVFRDHRRTFEEFRYVYAVVSRRSQGVSVGINLNPDKICNFDCVYCQVDRRIPPVVRDVDASQLLDELEEMLDLVESGALFEKEHLYKTPAPLRRLNDIAFAGDGEPTTCPEFSPIVEAVAEVRKRRELNPVKLVLISNASRFHVPRVSQALAVLDANNGEVWAKLEAGTEAYYRTIERTTIPFETILRNITQAACVRPIVIQALFMRLRGEPPSIGEQQVFCDRLNEIVRAGGAIRFVQVYTVARVPAESYVSPLHREEVDSLVEMVRERCGLAAMPFYGPE